MATITSCKVEVLKPDPEDVGKIIVRIVGAPKSILLCKFYLVSSEILTSHELSPAEIEQLRLNKEADKPEEAVESNLAESKKCFYTLWNVVDERSCVISGMVGKPDEQLIREYMKKFGDIEKVTTRDESSFIVTFASPASAIFAMNKPDHLVGGNMVQIVPFRHGDDESDRRHRVVILENLPKID